MIERIKELRKQVPIPMSEASQLLKANNADVEACVALFKARAIEQICDETECGEKMATEYYEAEKMDINRTISNIREALFDENYAPIENITIENIKTVHRWLNLIEEKDFITSLDYPLFNDVILVLSSVSDLQEISEIMKRAAAIKNSYFEGYSDANSMDEFIRRNRLLDDNVEMQNINNSIPVRITLIEKELSRHLRNLYRKETFE